MKFLDSKALAISGVTDAKNAAGSNEDVVGVNTASG